MTNCTHCPRISVIMSVYNGAVHLREAVDSILAQSFTDFEFIIVDDASTDTTPSILASYAKNDLRVRILTNTVNRERSYSRNLAIREAKAPLVAIMDADDCANPTRLAKQYEYMQLHSEIAVLGGAIECFEQVTGILRWPEHHDCIVAQLLFANSVAHPTVMARKNVLMEGYDIKYPSSEDYELWSRLAFEKNVRFANLADVILRYRVVIKNGNRDFHYKVALSNLRSLNIVPSARQEDLHKMLCFESYETILRLYTPQEVVNWFFVIYEASKSCNNINSAYVLKMLLPRIVNVLKLTSWKDAVSCLTFSRILNCLHSYVTCRS